MRPVAERLIASTAMVMDAAHTRSRAFATFRDAVIKFPMRAELGGVGEAIPWRASDVSALDLKTNGSFQIVSAAHRTEAAGKIFVQPRVTSVGGGAAQRLFEGPTRARARAHAPAPAVRMPERRRAARGATHSRR